jgi:hypothetical protein
VSREAEQGLGATAACPEIVDPAEAQALDAETLGLEGRNQQFLAAAVDRTDGGTSDQCFGELQGVNHSVRGVSRVDPEEWRGFISGIGSARKAAAT